MNWPVLKLNEEHFNFHLRYKHFGTFANCKYAELSYPQKSEIRKKIRNQSINKMKKIKMNAENEGE